MLPNSLIPHRNAQDERQRSEANSQRGVLLQDLPQRAKLTERAEGHWGPSRDMFICASPTSAICDVLRRVHKWEKQSSVSARKSGRIKCISVPHASLLAKSGSSRSLTAVRAKGKSEGSTPLCKQSRGIIIGSSSEDDQGSLNLRAGKNTV
jgi:hypothetical protein